MTWLQAIHYGLTSGLTYTEMHTMAPGLVCDLYVLRQRYDDEQHRIRRKSNKIYD